MGVIDKKESLCKDIFDLTHIGSYEEHFLNKNKNVSKNYQRTNMREKFCGNLYYCLLLLLPSHTSLPLFMFSYNFLIWSYSR